MGSEMVPFRFLIIKKSCRNNIFCTKCSHVIRRIQSIGDAPFRFSPFLESGTGVSGALKIKCITNTFAVNNLSFVKINCVQNVIRLTVGLYKNFKTFVCWLFWIIMGPSFLEGGLIMCWSCPSVCPASPPRGKAKRHTNTKLGRKGPWDISTPWTNFKVKGSEVKVTAANCVVGKTMLSIWYDNCKDGP